MSTRVCIELGAPWMIAHADVHTVNGNRYMSYYQMSEGLKCYFPQQ